MDAALNTVKDIVPEVSLWILILGFFVSFVLAFGIGSNDVANSFGTSVGSKVLTLKTACLLATIMEISGAVLLGYKVSDTIRKGIVDVNVYKDNPQEYMLGNLAALGGSAIWLIMATFLKMPISGTHSIVGSVLGFSLVAHGTEGIQWTTMIKIVASWFISPLLSGVVSGSIFWLIRRFILSRDDPIKPGLKSLPIFYGLTVFINIISVMLDGPEIVKVSLKDQPWFSTFFGVLISVVLGLLVAILIRCVMVPKLNREIQQELRDGPQALSGSNTGDLVVFVIGGNGNLTPEDSKEQTPINISMSDFRTTEKSMEAGLGFNGNGYINSFEPNHNHPVNNINEKNAKNENFNNYNSSQQNHNNQNMRNHHTNNAQGVTLEVIPVDGLSPNSSAVPLIKSGTGTTVSSMDNDANIIRINADGFDSHNNPTGARPAEDDKPGVGKLFSMLQIMTAAFGSFAHGGNDVSNAIGPLIALWLVYQEGSVAQTSQTPIWLLVYGGVGISLGLWIWGRRVIKTMGEDLTKITPSSGFTIEIGAAITVLLASKIGLPVSTTHCKVGSVVTVGQVRTKGGVDWKLFRNIFLAWIVTVPISAAISAVLMVILRAVV